MQFVPESITKALIKNDIAIENLPFEKNEVQRWIDGCSVPDANQLAQLSDALNVPIPHFYLTNTLGDRLRLSREKMGLTYAAVANRVHLSESRVIEWENDTAIPNTTSLSLLGNMFNVSLGYLLGLTASNEMPERGHDKLLSARLTAIRKHKKVSQKQLSEMIGVKQSTVSSWELATNGFPLEQRKKVAEVLGVTLAQLNGDQPLDDMS